MAIRFFAKRIPGSIIILLLGTLAAWAFQLPLETIGDRFGEIPNHLPTLIIPTFRPDLILPLLAPAITVAMLGAIESLLSAVVADKLSQAPPQEHHRPNMELVAQGLANIASPLLGGLPATGAIARTATNIKAGAKTPMAGIIHAVTLLIILLFAAPLAKHIPMALLAAILMVVAYHMGEWREVPKILKLSPADISVWLITFLLTVLADLTVAVEAGMILAALLFIRRVTYTTSIWRVTSEYVSAGHEHSFQTNPIPDNVAVFGIHGPFLFGATEKLNTITDQLEQLPQVVILRLRNMSAIDATGIQALEELAKTFRSSGRHLILCAMRKQPKNLMALAGLENHVGPDNIQPTLKAALESATALLEK